MLYFSGQQFVFSDTRIFLLEEQRNILAYPNPIHTDDQLYVIDKSFENQQIEVRIFDANGRLITQKTKLAYENKLQLDLPSWI